MIQHILKICRNQKSANLWIWLEMTFVSVVLWFVVDMIYTSTKDYFTPLGHDINHVYKIDISSIPGEPLDSLTNAERIHTMVDRVRTYKGVEVVSLSIYSMPYSYASAEVPFELDTAKIDQSTFATIRWVSPEFFEIFRCNNMEGQTAPLMKAISDGKTIVSKTVEEFLYLGQNSIGKKIYINRGDEKEELEIGEVITHFKTNEFEKGDSYFLFLPLNKEMIEQQPSNVELCVRITPEEDHDFPERFKSEMGNSLIIGNLFITDVTSLSNIRVRRNFTMVDEVNQNFLIALFLMMNIFLGVAGTFWYRTRQRKNEMGLRIAMGSTRSGLQQLMIGEGLVLLTLSILPAVIIAFNIGLTDMINVDRMPFTMNRFLITQAVTVWLMALMVCIGIYFPARSISRLQPADALRYE
ncbi:FtsX-like permease family protein [Porphyromonadaceae bacterium]